MPRDIPGAIARGKGYFSFMLLKRKITIGASFAYAKSIGLCGYDDDDDDEGRN